MRSAHDRCASAVRRADHDGGRGELADGGGWARDRRMDSRNCAARLTITQAEKSTARTNVCGTRVSGDPGAASFPGPPSAANRCLTSISLGKMAPNAARRCAMHGVRRAPPCGRYPPTVVLPACGRRPRSRPLGSAGRRCRPNFFSDGGRRRSPNRSRLCHSERRAAARSQCRSGGGRTMERRDQRTPAGCYRRACGRQRTHPANACRAMTRRWRIDLSAHGWANVAYVSTARRVVHHGARPRAAQGCRALASRCGRRRAVSSAMVHPRRRTASQHNRIAPGKGTAGPGSPAWTPPWFAKLTWVRPSRRPWCGDDAAPSPHRCRRGRSRAGSSSRAPASRSSAARSCRAPRGPGRC